jgi:hypothetical protein
MIITTKPDKEKAKSIYALLLNRKKFLESLKLDETSSTIIGETYYEIIKELGVILLLLKGFKVYGEYAHKEILEYLEKENILTKEETFISQDLRIKRNYSSYEGKPISKSYILSKKEKLLLIISKLDKKVEGLF